LNSFDSLNAKQQRLRIKNQIITKNPNSSIKSKKALPIVGVKNLDI